MDELFDPTYEPGIRNFFGWTTFFVVWVAFTFSHGLLGFCLGWFPAMFAAGIAFILAPLLLFAALIGGAIIVWLVNNGS